MNVSITSNTKYHINILRPGRNHYHFEKQYDVSVIVNEYSWEYVALYYYLFQSLDFSIFDLSFFFLKINDMFTCA